MAAVLGGSSAFSALAAPPSVSSGSPASQVTPWIGGKVSNGNAASAYCAVESKFDNGIVLSIALSPAGAINLVLNIPGLSAVKGDKWPVLIALDGQGTVRTAQVFDTTPSGAALVAIPFGDLAQDGARLQTGAALSIRAKADQASFSLDGSGQAIKELSACVAALQ